MEQLSLFQDKPEGMTLKEFNGLISSAINGNPTLRDKWVRAETSDLSVRRNGHCYLELVQKNEQTGVIEAKLSAMIWANNYKRIAEKFKQGTGMDLTTGMKVLIMVSASYHEAYGIKVVINDIDPTYTEGDMARRRREILEKLKSEDLIDRNKQLPWALAPQRVAVISAAAAAGYGDFINQLHGNSAGIKFYTCLFPSLMQGTQTRDSVLEQMRRVYQERERFDCLVIIRGGGSTSDLNCFDDYDLARAVAIFPLPVIVGIGHERDTTVLDDVAAMRVKTPTAAAEWLINRCTTLLTRLVTLTTALQSMVSEAIAGSREQLTYLSAATSGAVRSHMVGATTRFNALSVQVAEAARNSVSGAATKLDALSAAILPAVQSRLSAEQTRGEHLASLVANEVNRVVAMEQLRLDSLAGRLDILSPRNVLNRGFAIVRNRERRYVTTIGDIHVGDNVLVHLDDGRFAATVAAVTPTKP